MLVFNIPTYGVNCGIVFRFSDSISISRMYNARESLIARDGPCDMYGIHEVERENYIR